MSAEDVPNKRAGCGCADCRGATDPWCCESCHVLAQTQVNIPLGAAVRGFLEEWFNEPRAPISAEIYSWFEAVWDEGYLRGTLDAASDLEPADNPYREVES